MVEVARKVPMLRRLFGDSAHALTTVVVGSNVFALIIVALIFLWVSQKGPIF